MPPRARGGKRAPPGRRLVRGRASAKLESNVKADEEEEVLVKDADEKLMIAMEEREKEMVKAVEEKPPAPEEEGIRVSPLKKDDPAKGPIDDYEKDERLDLDINEPEEYYDEKETEPEPQEEGDEVREELEEADLEEEEVYVVEEEIESIPDEFEPGEGDEHVGEGEAHGAVVEEEHKELVKERRKRKEFEIFVGGLDKDATEDDLRAVFSAVGEITEVRLMMNPHTNKNKGFAFLQFATVEQAKRACVQLKNPVVHGKQCGVTPSHDSDTLFLGNICKTWTEETLKENLKHYGVETIEDLTLVEDTNNSGMNRGFAFLEFASRSDAMDAFKLLQKRNTHFGVDRPAKVSFADSFIDPGDEIMAQVKTVFVDGLLSSWKESYVKDLLKKYGDIVKVELASNMPAAKRKDFGFVTFNTHDAAVICAKSINNVELGEGEHKAKVRARLSRPLQRSKGKTAHADFRPGRGLARDGRSEWGGPVSRPLPSHGPRGLGLRPSHVLDRVFRKPVNIRDRREVMPVPTRSRPVPVPPMSRSYDKRVAAPPYPRGGSREYDHREELHGSKVPRDYHSRIPFDRRASYRDEYSHASDYPVQPRGGPLRSAARRAYVDDSYSPRYERPPMAYREGNRHDYDSVSGSKRPYTAMDDDPPHYSEAGIRHARTRLDYDGTSASHYSDTYNDRIGRSTLGYGGSRNSMSSYDSHGYYSGRSSDYGGGSYARSDDGGSMYSSSYNSGYMSRGSDVGSGSYSSLYSGRGSGGHNYMGSGRSGSYY